MPYGQSADEHRNRADALLPTEGHVTVVPPPDGWVRVADGSTVDIEWDCVMCGRPVDREGDTCPRCVRYDEGGE